jgi:endonuclease YncB( thermonuclease family)
LRRLAALIAALVLLLWPGGALAAEMLQVRGATLLQLGDQNRSYTVQLACIVVPEAQRSEAVDWLRQAAPRRTRVNLRPMGQNQGVLLARVQTLSAPQPRSGSTPGGTDLASGLVAAGLAQVAADADPSGDCANLGA